MFRFVRDLLILETPFFEVKQYRTVECLHKLAFYALNAYVIFNSRKTY